MPRNQQFEQDDFTGVLFKNVDKTHEKQPDYRGSVTVQGQKYWLSAWINEAKSDGSKYMSLALTEIEEDRPQRSSRSNGRPPARQPERQPERSSGREPERSRSAAPPQRSASKQVDPDLEAEPDDIPF
jgi:hypothetical protein